jgi:hypothetical protein
LLVGLDITVALVLDRNSPGKVESVSISRIADSDKGCM